VSITVEKMNPSILQVMGYSIEGAGKNEIELRQLAEYTVKPYLSRVDGVSEVQIIGGKIKEYHVVLDPVKMSSLGVTPQNVASVLSQNNFLSSNGYVSDYDRLYLSVTDAAIEDIDKLENSVIKATFQREIRLKDIGTVEIAPKREYIKINANGKDVPLIAITKQANTNLILYRGMCRTA